jgi:hypothetical protein
MASEAHLFELPLNSTIFFGADPCWTPEREGKVERGGKNPSTTHCRVCGGLLLLSKRDPYYVEGVEYRADEDMPVRLATMGDPGFFLLPDGMVVQPADKSELLMDSDFVIVACARCGRVPERYKGRLRGVIGTENMKRLSHRAARIIGKPEASLNPYVTAAERHEAAKAKAQKKAKGSKAAKPRKTAKAVDCSRKPRGASRNSPR